MSAYPILAGLLDLLAEAGKNGLTMIEIVEKGAKFDEQKLRKTVSNCASRDLVKSIKKEGEPARYAITNSGLARLAIIKKNGKSDDEKPKEKKKKKTRSPRKLIQNENNSPKLPPSISPEANDFSEKAALILGQNAQYRAALLEMRQTIDKLLNQ